MRPWWYDHVAVWADRAGHVVSAPFFRLASWAGRRYWSARG